MSTGQIDFQDVLQLVELIKASSNFSEIKLRSGDVEVELRRSGGGSLAAPAAIAAAAPVMPPAAAPEPAAPQARPARPAAEPAQPVATQPSPKPAAPAAREGATIVESPMVGTVYLAPEPGAPAFVQLGQAVGPGDPVCIVEVMKLMNSIPAGCGGVVTEILVADGEAVEHGQPLFVISPR
ncbi:hypothetical protein GCM10023165_24260 [Variovorax defluvii]|uniref:Biotin carboxyl carrier protein of acetyl-CoA carboxylase n=1 Tax=Variovorax defluvii TaxID=913761 RepID=A0ABP8HQ13_9BURK